MKPKEDSGASDARASVVNVSFFTKRKTRREGQTAFFKERTYLASVPKLKPL